MGHKRKRQYLVNFKNNEANKSKRTNPEHFIFFDTETLQSEEQKHIGKKDYKTIINTLKMGWACYWNKETGETDWIYFEAIEEFNKFVSKKISQTGAKVLWLVAHNIVFDNFIVDIWDFFQKKGYEDNFIHAKGMVYLQKLTRYSYKFSKKKQDVNKKVEKTIMLINNGNMFPAKLETIGKTVGFKKLEVDFENSTSEEIKIYCRRDVEILLEFWKQWTKFLADNKLGNIKYTISAQSMEAFKRRFCKAYIVLDDDMENLAFERQAYYGGRTEIFYKGAVKKHIYYYDVNSMYPYVMKNFRYPIEYKFTKLNPSIEQVQYYIDAGWLLIAQCYMDAKPSNNAYPCRLDNTLLFPTNRFITYLATPEIIEGLTNGDIVKFGKVSLYRGANIFNDYIDFFYDFRLTLKSQCMYKNHRCERLPGLKFKDNHIGCEAELCNKCQYKGNEQERMVKLFLNSLYGKFGQMQDVWSKTSIEEIKKFDPDFDFDGWIMDDYQIPKIIIDGLDVTPKIRYIGGELQIAVEREESNMSFPAISAHVTSYARMIIWNAMKFCKKNKIKFYYCDTDSMFTENELPIELVDNKELGKFKVEKEYPYGVEFINLKNYCPLNENGNKIVINEDNETVELNDEVYQKESKILKGDKWKMKGVRADAEMLDENTFIAQEWGGLPKQEYYKKFGRKSGEFWVIYKLKTNHGTIKKGHVKKSGDIIPYELNEWEDE